MSLINLLKGSNALGNIQGATNFIIEQQRQTSDVYFPEACKIITVQYGRSRNFKLTLLPLKQSVSSDEDEARQNAETNHKQDATLR